MAPDPILAIILGAAASLSFAVVYVAVPLLMPLFVRYAMARPNARSSHATPVPQGGGAPVVVATVVVTFLLAMTGAYLNFPRDASQFQTLALLGALALAMLGAADDMNPMSLGWRLAMQLIVCATIVFGAPDGWRLVTSLPIWAERALVTIGFVWMVNLTNFMDGIDGMVTVETVPISGALACLAVFHGIDAKAGVIAACLGGAMLGFATFNRHPAKLFLGDVGSLPIGFLLAALLYQLAGTRSLAAALILPAYFLADATMTLLKGLSSGHNVLQPHRRHAYQVAVDNGWSQQQVTRTVLTLNLVLVVLAGLSLLAPSASLAAALVGVAYGATLLVIARLRQGRVARV